MSVDVKPRVKVVVYFITMDSTVPMDPKYRLWTADPLQPITKFLPTYEACHEALDALWAEKEIATIPAVMFEEREVKCLRKYSRN